jgi:hypothetical protein
MLALRCCHRLPLPPHRAHPIRHRRHQSSASKNNDPTSTQGGGASYSIREPPNPSSSSMTTTIRDRVKIIPLGRGVVHVQLSRPNKLNSLDIPMFEAIAEAASRLRNDPVLKKNLRAVIMSGEGRAFCTGLDAKGVALSGPSESLKRLLERPSPYGGDGGLGNLAQDVCYLWRRVIFFAFRSSSRVCVVSIFSFLSRISPHPSDRQRQTK